MQLRELLNVVLCFRTCAQSAPSEAAALAGAGQDDKDVKPTGGMGGATLTNSQVRWQPRAHGKTSCCLKADFTAHMHVMLQYGAGLWHHQSQERHQQHQQCRKQRQYKDARAMGTAATTADTAVRGFCTALRLSNWCPLHW